MGVSYPPSEIQPTVTIHTIHAPHPCVRDLSTSSIIHPTLSTVRSTLYTGHCTLYTVHYALYTVHCPVSNLQWTMYTVKCTMSPVQCTLHITQCKLTCLSSIGGCFPRTQCVDSWEDQRPMNTQTCSVVECSVE